MLKTTVTAFVPKKTNHIWTGHADVISFDLKHGFALLSMTSGSQKGHIGGFDLDKIRFTVTRTEVEE